MSYHEELARIKAKEVVREGLKSQHIHRVLVPSKGLKLKSSVDSNQYLQILVILMIGLALGGFFVSQIVF